MKLNDDDKLDLSPKLPDIHRFMFKSSIGGVVLMTEIDVNVRESGANIVSTVSPEEASKWEFEKRMLLEGEMREWLNCVSHKLMQITNGLP